MFVLAGMNFLWVGVGGCEHFMGACGWVWVGVTFLWVGVGWCGSVWVGVQNDITDLFFRFLFF